MASADQTTVGRSPAGPGQDGSSSLVARMRENERLSTFFWPTVAVIAFLAIWEWISKSGTVNEIILPAPSNVFTALIELAQTADFWQDTWVTTQETVIGFVIGVTVAWVLGTLIGLFRFFSLALYPIIVAIEIVPRIALAPVFLTWFGFGIGSKIMMAAAICFFPVLINVILGVRTVDTSARALMRSFGASRLEEYRKLTLPSSAPAIFAALKVAIVFALTGAIVAEFVGANEGMGILIKTLNFQLLIAESFAVIIGLAIMGLIFYGVTTVLEAKIVFWRGHGAEA